jgi:hypothetical protein
LDDLHQVYSDLENSLGTFGVVLTGVKSAVAIRELESVRFVGMMEEQGVLEEETQMVCLQFLRDSRDIIASLACQVELLEEIEDFLHDWLWGLAYQLARDGFGESRYLSGTLPL